MAIKVSGVTVIDDNRNLPNVGVVTASNAQFTSTLSVGTNAVTINGTSNTINVGTGITINGASNLMNVGTGITFFANGTINVGSAVTIHTSGFQGSGANLSSLNANNLASGTIPAARYATNSNAFGTRYVQAGGSPSGGTDGDMFFIY